MFNKIKIMFSHSLDSMGICFFIEIIFSKAINIPIGLVIRSHFCVHFLKIVTRLDRSIEIGTMKFLEERKNGEFWTVHDNFNPTVRV